MVVSLYSNFEPDLKIENRTSKTFDENQINYEDILAIEGITKTSKIVEEIKGHRNLSERILQSLKPAKEPIKETENEVE